MNKRLEDAITRLKSQPEERQQEAAEILFDFLEQDADVYLSPEQIAEIRRCLSDSEPYADDTEVKEVFARLTK
jgi:hypothetical protein